MFPWQYLKNTVLTSKYSLSINFKIGFKFFLELSLNNAILAEEKHVPLYDELAKTFEVEYIAGGAGQNSIRVAQWMLGIPGCTAYFGSIGNDAYGDKLQTCASSDGVLVHYQRTADAPTVLQLNIHHTLYKNL